MPKNLIQYTTQNTKSRPERKRTSPIIRAKSSTPTRRNKNKGKSLSFDENIKMEHVSIKIQKNRNKFLRQCLNYIRLYDKDNTNQLNRIQFKNMILSLYDTNDINTIYKCFNEIDYNGNGVFNYGYKIHRLQNILGQIQMFPDNLYDFLNIFKSVYNGNNNNNDNSSNNDNNDNNEIKDINQLKASYDRILMNDNHTVKTKFESLIVLFDELWKYTNKYKTDSSYIYSYKIQINTLNNKMNELKNENMIIKNERDKWKNEYDIQKKSVDDKLKTNYQLNKQYNDDLIEQMKYKQKYHEIESDKNKLINQVYETNQKYSELQTKYENTLTDLDKLTNSYNKLNQQFNTQINNIKQEYNDKMLVFQVNLERQHKETLQNMVNQNTQNRSTMSNMSREVSENEQENTPFNGDNESVTSAKHIRRFSSVKSDDEKGSENNNLYTQIGSEYPYNTNINNDAIFEFIRNELNDLKKELINNNKSNNADSVDIKQNDTEFNDNNVVSNNGYQTMLNKCFNDLTVITKDKMDENKREMMEFMNKNIKNNELYFKRLMQQITNIASNVDINMKSNNESMSLNRNDVNDKKLYKQNKQIIHKLQDLQDKVNMFERNIQVNGTLLNRIPKAINDRINILSQHIDRFLGAFIGNNNYQWKHIFVFVLFCVFLFLLFVFIINLHQIGISNSFKQHILL